MSVSFEHDNLGLPLRKAILEIVQASLVGADPYRSVRRSLDIDDNQLVIGDRVEDLKKVEEVMVVGAGKATAPMAQAVEDVVGTRLGNGVVAVKDGYATSTSSIAVGEAAHPVPDQRSVKAARAVSHVAEGAGDGDLVICLFSGGGSSILEMPAGELGLEELQETTATLLAAGIPIESINAVRKHLSSVKGGRLAERIAPARHVTIVISDVVGDRLDLVASGPTVPDPTTFADALEVIEGEALSARIPEPVIEHLEAGARGELSETPDAEHAAFDHGFAQMVCSRADAVDAAKKAAFGGGYHTEVMTTELSGEAREVGREIAEAALRIIDEGEPISRPACLLYAGETTVTVRGRGKGGRNQELCLAAAIALDEASEAIETPVALGAFATDGTDGPTRAAGAIVGPDTVSRIRDAGHDPVAGLENNNSYPLLGVAGDLIFTGPTRNNVNDLICVLIE